MTSFLSARRVGRGDLAVTILGFGGASIGNLYGAMSDRDARKVVDVAWDRGIRYFDTAPHYGVGLSERRLGAALADRPREEFVLSTKVGRLLVPNSTPSGSDLANGFDTSDALRRELDYSGPGTRRSVEESLTRLGLDYFDVALVHDPDDHVDQTLTGALPALIAMRDEGIVRAIGVGMNQWQAPLRFVVESDLDVVMLAGRWTLLDRTGFPLLEECHRRGVSVFAAAPFNSGLLAHADPNADSHFDYAVASQPLVEAARALADLARDHGTTLPHVALHFPLRHRAVASVVTGLAKSAHVEGAVQWLDTPVSEAFWPEADLLVERFM